jgi:hypothetical protein
MLKTKLREQRRFNPAPLNPVPLNPTTTPTDRSDAVKSTNQIQREAKPTIITAVIVAKISSTEYDAPSMSIISHLATPVRGLAGQAKSTRNNQTVNRSGMMEQCALIS